MVGDCVRCQAQKGSLCDKKKTGRGLSGRESLGVSSLQVIGSESADLLDLLGKRHTTAPTMI